MGVWLWPLLFYGRGGTLGLSSSVVLVVVSGWGMALLVFDSVVVVVVVVLLLLAAVAVMVSWSWCAPDHRPTKGTRLPTRHPQPKHHNHRI